VKCKISIWNGTFALENSRIMIRRSLDSREKLQLVVEKKEKGKK
jgi:hypothetical protein